jgi:hypothetical protein
LIREGDAPSGLPAGHTVEDLLDPAVNHVGGVGVSLMTSDGTTETSHFWGAKSPAGPPSVLRSEGLHHSLEQLWFEGEWGLSDGGEIAYSAVVNDLVGGAAKLDTVWLDEALLCEEGQPVAALPGVLWGDNLRPDISADGIPYWLSDLTDATTGSGAGRGLFIGRDANILLATGTVLPNTGGPVGAIGHDYRLSALARHYITEIRTTEAHDEAYMILDGRVIVVGGPGGFVHEGVAVPPSIGGLPGETWQYFDFCGVNEALDWFFTGGASGEIIVQNGVIRYRESDVLDGEVLTGGIEDAYMNEAGNLAFIWDVEAPVHPLEALYVNDDLVIKVGDPVDLDGDGLVDPKAFLVWLEDVVIGDDNKVYFLGTVDPHSPAGLTEAFFRVDCLPMPYGSGKLNSAGSRARLSYAGSPRVPTADFSLQVSGLTPGNLGLAFWGTAAAQTPFANHFLYVAPPITRILPAQASGPAGDVSVPIPVTPAMVGTTRYYQYWQRDPAAPDGTGAELSSALQVDFCN